MSVDVDAVSERLNGLLTLLKAVGVDGDTKGNNGDPALEMARQLNDEQIEAIVKKLQAQADAPLIIAALEAHAGARSLVHNEEEEVVEEEVEEEVVEETEEEEEDDDDFDEDANYPMVGHGVSDDISVVSDLTTPTVVHNVQVPEEEHYRETLPPMIVGGVGEPSMVISAPKRKNLVSQIRPPSVGALAPPSRRVIPGFAHHQHHLTVGTGGGAAAARRKMYLDTMAKLHENPNGMGYVGPAAAPSSAPKLTLKTVTVTPPANFSSSASSSGGAKLRSGDSAVSKKDKSKKSSSGKSSSKKSDPDWNTFEEPAVSSNKKSSSKSAAGVPAGPTVIDDDGFLVGDSSFDPFASGSNPFKSSTGDLEFGAGAGFISSDHSAPGAFDAFGSSGVQGRSSGSVSGKKKSSKSKKTSEHHGKSSKSNIPNKQASSGDAGTKRRVSRRASAV